jgi:putative addiction module component (TIGR02574 family)
MVRTLPIPPPGFDELSVEEKLDYVESLWDRILDDPQGVPVPDWHLQIVRERMVEYEADPESGNISLDEFREMLGKKPPEAGR